MNDADLQERMQLAIERISEIKEEELIRRRSDEWERLL